jgi:hypothetical protein
MTSFAAQRLPDGRIRIPILGWTDGIRAHGWTEIDADHPDYPKWAAHLEERERQDAEAEGQR